MKNINSLTREGEKEIKESYLRGELFITSVNPENLEIRSSRISNVLKHSTKDLQIFCVTLEDGSLVKTTGDHSLFTIKDNSLCEVRSDSLSVGDAIVFLEDENLLLSKNIRSIEILDPEEFTYDLSVPGDENFLLSNGILAHNSYSIGGVSLDINRSSNYQALKGNAEEQFTKATEVKTRTTKIMRGLRQNRFSPGVRSSFGPYTGRGVLGPRSFL